MMLTDGTFLISEDSRGIDAPPPSKLVESVNGEKKLYIEGIFAQSEMQNRNKRRYPQKVLFEATQEYITRAVSPRNASALGELNHPEYPHPNAKEACHVVTELKFEGNDVVGKAEVLEDLPNGKIVASLLERNIELGVSTRGVGAISESGGQSTVNRYKMFAVDVVTVPSAHKALVKPLMEGVEWAVAEGNYVVESLDVAQAVLREAEQVKLNQFLKLMSRFSTRDR